MKIWPAALCVVALFAATKLHARLGETIYECTVRYGMPVRISKTHPSIEFKKDGISFHCNFVEGKCDSMMISRLSESLADAEVDALLESNCGGWTPTSTSPNKHWHNTTGGAAVFTGQTLFILARVRNVNEDRSWSR